MRYIGKWINGLPKYNHMPFETEGLQLVSSSFQYVDTSGVPMNLAQCSVIFVAKVTDLSTDRTIAQCIQTSTDNGFSIDIASDGALSFRVQNNELTKVVSYPSGTVTTNTWFMTALRFDRGLLAGTHNQQASVRGYFVNYPLAPTVNSNGWFVGRRSADYVATAQAGAILKNAMFGQTTYEGQSITGSTTIYDYFDGIVAYTLFYDRPLYDFELSFIYDYLKTKLLAERGISLP